MLGVSLSWFYSDNSYIHVASSASDVSTGALIVCMTLQPQIVCRHCSKFSVAPMSKWMSQTTPTVSPSVVSDTDNTVFLVGCSQVVLHHQLVCVRYHLMTMILIMYHLDVINRTALEDFKMPNCNIHVHVTTYQICFKWVKTLIKDECTKLIMLHLLITTTAPLGFLARTLDKCTIIVAL